MITEEQQIKDGDISLKDFIKKLRRWRQYIVSKYLVMLFFIFSGAVIGVVFAFIKKPIYTAVTTFVLEDDQKGGGLLGQYSGLASMVGVDVSGSSNGIFEGDNIIELYKSRMMIQKTLLSEVSYKGKNTKLIDIYIGFNNLRARWSKEPELRNINFDPRSTSFTRTQDSVISGIVDNINLNYLSVAKPDKKLAIFEVMVKAEDEVFAKLFNDKVVQTVNDFYVNTKTKKALQNLRILQHQTDSVRAILNGAITQSAVVNDATPNINPTRQVLRVPAQRSIYNADANKAMLSQLIQNLELAKLALQKETPLIQVIDNPLYPLAKNALGKVKGLILGAVVGTIVSIFLLSFRRILKRISDVE